MKEPSVSVQMVVDTIPNTVVSGQNIAGGVIIADCGTLEPKLFYSSTEVLKEFTKSGKITRQTDTTLIHAAAIADIMPVLLKRSFDDDGTRAGFGIYKNKIAYNNTLDISFLGITDPTEIAKIIAGQNVIIDGVEISVEAADASQSPVTYDDSTYGITAAQYRVVATEDFNQIWIQTSDTSYDHNSFSYVYVADNYGEENYINPSKISYDSNNGRITIETGSYHAGDVVVVVFSQDVSVSEISTVWSEPITFEECYFKRGDLLEYKQPMTLSVLEINPMNFCIGINGSYFYNAITGDPQVPLMTGIAVDGIGKKSTTRNIVDAINKMLSDGYIEWDGNNWNVYSSTQYSQINQDAGGKLNNTTGPSQSILKSAGGGFTFTLIARFPSSIDFSGKVGPSSEDEDLFDVTVITANRTYEYSGSTDKDYVNAYGANQFIENINDYDGIPFEVHVLKDEDGNVVESKDILQTPSISFGKMNIGLGEDLSTRKAALEEICDLENVKIAFLCPFGYPNNGYLQKMATYTTKLWNFMPVGLYVYKDDPEAIIANRPALSTEYAMIMAPHDKSTLMTDWVVDMSLEVAYLAKVTSNAAKSCEFAPMMGKDQATFQVTKPSVNFRKSSREKLLDARIMSLITRTSEGVSYLNKNKCSGGNTILSEDQNVRLACKINRDLDTLLEPILGRFNTEETRDRVTRMINTYFQNNILNQVYSIDSYTVVCDESNNPPEIRANNQLVVDLSVVYLNAIYEILVYHRALDVASATQ